MTHCIEATEATQLTAFVTRMASRPARHRPRSTGLEIEGREELELWRAYAITLGKLESLDYEPTPNARVVFSQLAWADVGVEAPEGYDFERRETEATKTSG